MTAREMRHAGSLPARWPVLLLFSLWRVDL